MTLPEIQKLRSIYPSIYLPFCTIFISCQKCICFKNTPIKFFWGLSEFFLSQSLLFVFQFYDYLIQPNSDWLLLQQQKQISFCKKIALFYSAKQNQNAASLNILERAV